MTVGNPPPARQGGRRDPLRCGGFTLVELITVVIIMGILSAALFTGSGTLSGRERARMAEVRSQIRYVQLRAMKTGSAHGMACDGTNYWAFSGSDSTVVANYLPLPGETGAQVPLTGKDMTMSSFICSFDGFGIPYTGNTPAKLNAPLTITITAGGNAGDLTITPETGHVP